VLIDTGYRLSIYARQEEIAEMFGAGIYTSMGGKRSANQKGILLVLDEAFRQKIDEAVAANGYDNRTQFIKEAVYEMLLALKLPLPAKFIASPSRKGKGGKPSHKSYPLIHVENAAVAETQGDYNIIDQSVSTSPSKPPGRGAQTAKAAKVLPKKKTSKKK